MEVTAGARAADGATFVLVHGAWHGGWCWRRVEPLLREAGHRVFCPTQTGLGERRHLMSPKITLDTFLADIVNLIEFEELEEVILVGHSFAGAVIRGVAGAAPERLRRLVYLDALIVEPGAAPFDSLPEEVVAARRRLARESSGGVSLPAPPPQAFGVNDPADAEWLARRLTPQPLGVYESPLSRDRASSAHLPRTYIASTAPRYAPFAGFQEQIAQDPGWGWLEIAAGHDAMITAPAALASLLVALAEDGVHEQQACEMQ